MRKLNRYIASSVMSAITIALLVFLALDLIGALLDQIGDVEGDYTFTEVLIYLGLTLPRRIYEYIPFASLVGALVGLGILASSSELTVMRAAGLSVRRITWMALRAALLFIGVAVLLAEFVIPLTNHMAESRRAEALGKSLQAEKGLWNREGREFIHIDVVYPGGKLLGVTRYQFGENRELLETSYTEEAIYQGDHWREEGVNVSRFDDGRIEKNHYPQRRWDSYLTPKLLGVLVLEPDALSMQSLYRYASYLDQQTRDSRRYWLAFWQKLLQPLISASLVLIAASFVFGSLRHVSLGQRVFTGLVFGIVFNTFQDLLGPASLVFGFSPFIAVLVPLVVSFAIGAVLLRRAR